MPDIANATDLIETKLVHWVREFIKLLPNLALAALIVVVAWLLAKLVRKIMADLMGRFTDSRNLNRLVSSSFYLIILLIGVFGALTVMHLDRTVTSILAGAGIIGLALGFAFQDIAANFLSGVIMAVQRPIRTGDYIETNGLKGVVEHIDLRTTEIRNLQGVQVVVPNKDIFQNVLTNYTRNASRRVDIAMDVARMEDLERFQRITIAAVETIGDLLPDHEVELFYTGFGESTIQCDLRFWISATNNKPFNTMRSLAIKAIMAAYAKENIMLPFPNRTVHLEETAERKKDATSGDNTPTGG